MDILKYIIITQFSLIYPYLKIFFLLFISGLGGMCVFVVLLKNEIRNIELEAHKKEAEKLLDENSTPPTANTMTFG